MLRPRLRPGWTPSWMQNGTYWRRAEDSVQLPVSTRFRYRVGALTRCQSRPSLVDATRIADGRLVYIKKVWTGDEESRIALVLCSYGDATNHSVPILDTFVDATNPDISYLVMPFLREVDQPAFDNIGDTLDFADQILEVSKIFSRVT